MVGALGCAGAPRGECVGCASVGREPPTGRCSLVDGPSDERVPEDELARHRCRANEVAGDQLIEGAEALRVRELGDRCREIGLERLAGDSRAPEQCLLLRRQRSDLLRQRGRDGSGYGNACDIGVDAGGVDRGRQSPFLARAPELLEVERVAAAVAIDRRGLARLEIAEQQVRLRFGERLEHDPLRGGHRECGRQRRRSGRGAKADCEQHGCIRLAAQQGGEQLERRLVAPVQVVEDDDERLLAREQLEQPADGPVGAVALVGDGSTLAVAARHAATE